MYIKTLTVTLVNSYVKKMLDNDIILNNLKNSNIYRTDINGGIEIVLYNKKYQIKTCAS